MLRILLCAALAAPLCVHAEEAAFIAPADAIQPDEGNSVAGFVKDALGQPIAGATLTLKNAADEVAGKVASDAAGQYAFPGIEPGTYAVMSEKTGYEESSAIVTVSQGRVSADITMAAVALEINITATRLESRGSAASQTGGSTYKFDAATIENLPQGDSTPLNQVLLQAPGVVNDSYGQIHVRGDHGNMQYRVNGVILPESITGFGQSLSAQFARSIDLMTGALPAQYGYRTAGVVEINTKSNFAKGGKVDVYAGSYNTFNPGIEYGNTDGNTSYFVTGSYLHNDVGVENTTSSSSPLHDNTDQMKGFGYLSTLLSPTAKVTLMFGSYDGRFQIPVNPGQPTYVVQNAPNGVVPIPGLPAAYDSTTVNDNQRELNRFIVAALQRSPNDLLDYQVSLFTRYSSVHYMPDISGNLAFNGVASDYFKSSSSTGIQADGTYRMNEAHTLRTGLFVSDENIVSNNTSTVFAVNGSGQPLALAYPIVDNNPKNGNTLFGIYLQDEWKASRRLTVNYGARFDAVNAYVSEHQLSPRLGLVYKTDDATTWHAGVARYFTPPPTELVSSSSLALFSGTTNAQSGANSPVKSERATYWDAGVERRLSDALNVGADTFYKSTTNLIDEGQFSPAPILTPYNYAQGKIYGVELTGNYKSGDFSGYANFARTVSLGRDIISSQYLFGADELAYAASNWINVDHEQALTLSGGASYLWQGTRFNGDMMFESGLRHGFDNTSSLPSYMVFNVGAVRKLALSGMGDVEGRVALNNLFDKVYEIRDGSGIGVFAPQYGQRRGVYLGVSKGF